MTEALKISQIHPIHPFPARMAPSIVWNNLPDSGKFLRVLDPMAGSGTSLVIAKARGYQAVGCDTDPLAVLIAHNIHSLIELKEQFSKICDNSLSK